MLMISDCIICLHDICRNLAVLIMFSLQVEKALIEMVNAADAAKLEAESKRQRIRLGGKILRITVSNTYSQVNTG